MDMQKCIGFINTPPLWKGEQFGIEQFDFPNVDVSLFKPEPIASKLRITYLYVLTNTPLVKLILF